MSFLDHLEELRWHLIRSFASIFIFALAAFFSPKLVFHTIILGPSRVDFWTYEMLCKLGKHFSSTALCITQLPFTLQSRQMSGQFTMHLTSSFIIGLICAFPYTFWEIWRFVRPGLHNYERKISRGATFFVTVLFVSGILFGYFLVAPLSINFLANYQIDPSIVNEFDINSYISTLVMLVLSCGLMFQLPIIVFFLSKAGIVTPHFMRHYRKHAIVVILIVAAIITPPDVMSQILVSIPLLFLYEVSIFISGMVLRGKEKELMNIND